MPGREVIPRTAVDKDRRPAGSPYAASLGPARHRLPKQQQPQQIVAVEPACECCLRLLHATHRVRQALEDVLVNARMVFLSDTLHHQMGDERWLRALQALGEEKTTYFARTVLLSNIVSTTDCKLVQLDR
ncbi:hypothetical protein DQ04_02541050 [Trypanosoma grayi]|uniref:hypothetical protein n=1 Tax=Trypanosoma grayi TaxID=71804 RepID=UPI0004F41F26|nr:hypothetical protein DQ04_02541050 [Trypanosoma grayi]KEG11516.1 hypothetical protein DQ04_02541050 [Trypanosoma grayi]